MDKITLALVCITFFVAGAYVGAAAMRNTYRKHYGRALAKIMAESAPPPDPQGGAE